MERNDFIALIKRLGKPPKEWLEERGYVKTFLGWMPQIKWVELVNKGAVASSGGVWMFSRKYNPNSVMLFVNGKGMLQHTSVKDKGSDTIKDFLNGLN